jgi:hypothetical protein
VAELDAKTGGEVKVGVAGRRVTIGKEGDSYLTLKAGKWEMDATGGVTIKSRGLIKLGD